MKHFVTQWKFSSLLFYSNSLMAKVLTMTIAGVVNIRVSLLLPLVDHSEWVEMFGSEGLNDTLDL